MLSAKQIFSKKESVIFGFKFVCRGVLFQYLKTVSQYLVSDMSFRYISVTTPSSHSDLYIERIGLLKTQV